jgi:ATPase subunit of ABC transporter with duplicated ATPase domains
MLTLAEISKSFGVAHAFRGRLAQHQPGRAHRAGRANGAGKSTLFSIILGTGEPDGGSVVLDRNTTLGYLPQETAASGDETVLELATAITPEHGRTAAHPFRGRRARAPTPRNTTTRRAVSRNWARFSSSRRRSAS